MFRIFFKAPTEDQLSAQRDWEELNTELKQAFEDMESSLIVTTNANRRLKELAVKYNSKHGMKKLDQLSSQVESAKTLKKLSKIGHKIVKWEKCFPKTLNNSIEATQAFEQTATKYEDKLNFFNKRMKSLLIDVIIQEINDQIKLQPKKAEKLHAFKKVLTNLDKDSHLSSEKLYAQAKQMNLINAKEIKIFSEYTIKLRAVLKTPEAKALNELLLLRGSTECYLPNGQIVQVAYQPGSFVPEINEFIVRAKLMEKLFEVNSNKKYKIIADKKSSIKNAREQLKTTLEKEEQWINNCLPVHTPLNDVFVKIYALSNYVKEKNYPQMEKSYADFDPIIERIKVNIGFHQGEVVNLQTRYATIASLDIKGIMHAKDAKEKMRLKKSYLLASIQNRIAEYKTEISKLQALKIKVEATEHILIGKLPTEVTQSLVKGRENLETAQLLIEEFKAKSNAGKLISYANDFYNEKVDYKPLTAQEILNGLKMEIVICEGYKKQFIDTLENIIKFQDPVLADRIKVMNTELEYYIRNSDTQIQNLMKAQRKFSAEYKSARGNNYNTLRLIGNLEKTEKDSPHNSMAFRRN